MFWKGRAVDTWISPYTECVFYRLFVDSVSEAISNDACVGNWWKPLTRFSPFCDQLPFRGKQSLNQTHLFG